MALLLRIFQIWQKYPAPAEFLPEPDFCRIWKKRRIPAGARSRYSASCCVISRWVTGAGVQL